MIFLHDRFRVEGSKINFKDLTNILRYSKLKTRNEQFNFKFSFIGEYKNSYTGNGLDYKESRKYQIGDDIRSIDWKITSRKNELYTKIYHQDHDILATLIVDQSTSMYFGTKSAFKSAIAASIATWFGWQAINNGYRISGYIFNNNSYGFIKASKNKKSFINLLSIINEFNNKLNKYKHLNKKFETQLHNIIKNILTNKNRSIVTILSDFINWDKKTEELLAKLALQHKVKLCLIYDEFEKNIPANIGIVNLISGSKIQKINTYSKIEINKYNDNFINRIKKIKSFCLKNNIIFKKFSTSEDILIYRV